MRSLQILHYEPGQQYRPHHICLQAAEVGGATCFPKANLSLSPPLGGAVFFNNTTVLGDPDPLTLHAGAPVEAGVKIVATCWQRERAFA